MSQMLALEVATGLAVLSAAVLLCDAAAGAYASHVRRRRRRPGSVGACGVVVDAAGELVGIYRDPFASPHWPARVHHEDSPWTSVGPDGRSSWAWEGFGETEEDARAAADRLRKRHRNLLPWLHEEEEDDAGGLPY